MATPGASVFPILVVERALPDDADALTAAAHESKATWGYPRAWIESWNDQLTLTPEYIRRHEVYAGRVKTKLAGFYALVDQDGQWCLDHFWVRPASLRQGVGRRLFADAVDRIRLSRPGRLVIDSDPHAEAFYLRMGCRRIGAVPANMPGVERSLPRLVYQVVP
jgi:GNAT superfamily N-acetyltransferase